MAIVAVYKLLDNKNYRENEIYIVQVLIFVLPIHFHFWSFIIILAVKPY